MDNRYYYLDVEGQVQGPVWLSTMRTLWQNGRVTMRTEISLTGTGDWQRLEFHPEITETQAQLPPQRQSGGKKSSPVRLLIWTILLFLAYVTWVIVHWDDGKRLKFHDDAPAASRP